MYFIALSRLITATIRRLRKNSRFATSLLSAASSAWVAVVSYSPKVCKRSSKGEPCSSSRKRSCRLRINCSRCALCAKIVSFIVCFSFSRPEAIRAASFNSARNDYFYSRWHAVEAVKPSTFRTVPSLQSGKIAPSQSLTHVAPDYS